MKCPKVFHHTPFIGLYAPAEWCVLEYTGQDYMTGYAGLFRLGRESKADVYRFKPRGIKADADYEIELYNTHNKFILPGSELLNKGLEIRLESVNTSELILYKQIGKKGGSK
jgi:hypothetical protein